MKRYQVAILFFAIGIFAVASALFYFSKELQNERIGQQTPAPIEYETLQVFFSNNLTDPQMLDCENVYPVDRAVRRLSDNKKSGLAEYSYLALAELLAGPGDADKVSGYFTSINEGTRVQGIIIEGETAIVDFNDKLNENVAGSCRVLAIRSQIKQTLLQFPEIVDVIITINGESEAILEP